ncbi:hypothetical protein [Halobacteriovorax sp. CON-3]|uniref:hypothetical protein n=1 Tax=Halobacteriovorax sp. CON-3 TaxID=3157710 RepID=UPI0037111235
MKKLIIALFLMATNAQAINLTYIYGGITPHIQKPTGPNARPLCNELSEGSGVIYNELHSVRFNYAYDWSTGLLVGENSYCEPIWGVTQSYNFYRNKYVEINGTAGFYHFDENGFDFSEGAYFANIGDFYFVPIIGAEVNFSLYKDKDFQISFMNLLTPVITNHSFGVTFFF